MLSSSVEARLEWAVSAGRPSFSSENETPFVRLARSQLLQCDDRQMCKATKETQKITLCITKDARRIRREDECCAKRRDANDKKKQALEFHTRSTTPQSVQACRKKCFKLHSGQKILKNVCHTFLVMFVNCNSNTLECCPNFGVLNYWNFFSIFPTV